MTNLARLLPEEVDQLMVGLGQHRYRADQALQAIYRRAARAVEELTQLPAALRAELAAKGYELSAAEAVRAVVSEDGETTKALLRMQDGTLVETVLMQYPELGERHPRSTVCVSTQAGCAMGCAFCATGQMGFERNLRAEEIAAQVLHFARELAGRSQHVTNVVFMGMGEPLANYEETIRAVRLLTHPRAFGLGQRHIMISTVGIIRGIDRLAEEDLQVGLAISLHAPNEALRQRLVPTAGPTSVRDLVAAGRRFFERTGRRVSYEYALIAGANDSPETARELAALLRGTGAHVNLIPLNPTAGSFERPSRASVLEFERVLQEAGVNCTVRVEKGTEISAACGQLRTDELEAGVSRTPSAPARGRRQAALARVPSQPR
jgi:23S rRNA (adenine2503-C2)-methyltransferase